MVNTAFQAYRNPGPRQALLNSLANYQLFDAKIKMVGVWDTVGALGIPALVGGVDPIAYGFLDTGLHPDVLNAYHALSIDERRQEFPPTLWTGATAPGQTMQQVWFSGVHCDVGGGYPETGLSDITFGWMMNKAAALGLVIDPAVKAQYAVVDAKNSLALKHESWQFYWLFPKSRTVANNSTLGNSAAIRCQYDNTYRPVNLQYAGGQLAGSYVISPVVSNPPN